MKLFQNVFDLSTTRISSGLINLQSNAALRDSKKEISYVLSAFAKETVLKASFGATFQYFSQLNICEGEKILRNENLKSNYRLFFSDKHLRLQHKVRKVASWFYKKKSQFRPYH
jgi:hypothetical protein